MSPFTARFDRSRRCNITQLLEVDGTYRGHRESGVIDPEETSGFHPRHLWGVRRAPESQHQIRLRRFATACRKATFLSSLACTRANAPVGGVCQIENPPHAAPRFGADPARAEHATVLVCSTMIGAANRGRPAIAEGRL
jgi:hypothetical protein